MSAKPDYVVSKLTRPTGGAATGGFVINLTSSTTPMALSQPKDPTLAQYTFFVSRRLEDGRERFRLHMGYFETMQAAEEMLVGRPRGLSRRLGRRSARQETARQQSCRAAAAPPRRAARCPRLPQPAAARRRPRRLPPPRAVAAPPRAAPAAPAPRRRVREPHPFDRRRRRPCSKYETEGAVRAHATNAEFQAGQHAGGASAGRAAGS